MKYEVGQVYDFRYNHPPVSSEEQYRPGTIVTISKHNKPIGKYNVISSNDTTIRGLICEMNEDIEYNTDHRVLFSLDDESVETLKNHGSVTYEVVFNMVDDQIVYDSFGPFHVLGES